MATVSGVSEQSPYAKCIEVGKRVCWDIDRDVIRGRRFDAHISTNRTCEIGMERATGRPYMHAVQLLEELTRSAPAP